MVGGKDDYAFENYSTATGRVHNKAFGLESTISGSYEKYVHDWASSVSGGKYNVTCDIVPLSTLNNWVNRF